MTEDIADPSPPKRKKGRQKTVQTTAPLVELEGNTKEEKLLALYNQWFGCTKCPLGKFREEEGRGKDIVFGVGNPNADIVIVGEAPGGDEEAQGSPFVGPAGQLLNKLLAYVTNNVAVRTRIEEHAKLSTPKQNADSKALQEELFDWRIKEFFFTNAVACRPPENRQPTPAEGKACWERVWNTIYTIDPFLIIAVGGTAYSVLTRSTKKITQEHGRVYDAVYDGKFGKVIWPVMPILHPSHLLRVADWKLKDGTHARTVNDLRQAMRLVDYLRLWHYGTPIPPR